MDWVLIIASAGILLMSRLNLKKAQELHAEAQELVEKVIEHGADAGDLSSVDDESDSG